MNATPAIRIKIRGANQYGLFLMRGTPKHIRLDNGAEFAAKAFRSRLRNLGLSTLYIEPGNPWENDYIESYIGKLRD
jgi:putative transposase